ncbi:stealth conserved region 3 domain-containing protein [Streptomyces sp. NPDC048639]|uniref:stealth conserved region 3 domain-containing protein n=1 Tax=Streptomyces sp. NPDC048639 TaxID=3365581 RepID=UPI00371F8834
MQGQSVAEPRPGAADPRGRATATGLPVNPEASALVSAYRRAIPVGVRRAIAGRSSPELRRTVKRHIGALTSGRPVHRLRAAHLAGRHQELLAAAGCTVALVDGQPRIALVERDLSPERARTANLVVVTGALEAAGVPYFCVRGRARGATVVAVARDDRDRALTALAGLCRTLPGYVSPLAHGNRDPRHAVPGYAPGVWRRFAAAEALRLTWYRTDPRQRLVLGSRHGCDVEFWAREDGRLTAPRRNAVTESVPVDGVPVRVPAALFTTPYGPTGAPVPGAPEPGAPVPGAPTPGTFEPRTPAPGAPEPGAPEPGTPEPRAALAAGAPLAGLLTVRTREEFTHPLPGDIAFPVDAVYTWVDGADPAWLGRRARFTDRAYHDEAANAARYANRDELRYSLRALETYAPWVRRVYLVTDDQTPAWLDTAHPRVTVVSHREMFRDPEVLPTFNSHAIESQLHRIEGLSEHFLYFNDDVFLGQEAVPDDFFLANGLTKFFPSPALVPLGPPSETDVPVSVAGKNNRALIEARFGTTPVQKMKHVPHALRRSVLAEIEEEFGEQHRATAAHRFRSRADIAIPSSLHHYYAFHTGRALPSDLDYAYIDLSRPNAAARLDRLLADRDRAVFCLNDTQSDEADITGQVALLHPFLDAYFPLPAPYELPG